MNNESWSFTSLIFIISWILGRLFSCLSRSWSVKAAIFLSINLGNGSGPSYLVFPLKFLSFVSILKRITPRPKISEALPSDRYWNFLSYDIAWEDLPAWSPKSPSLAASFPLFKYPRKIFSGLISLSPWFVLFTS